MANKLMRDEDGIQDVINILARSTNSGDMVHKNRACQQVLVGVLYFRKKDRLTAKNARKSSHAFTETASNSIFVFDSILEDLNVTDKEWKEFNETCDEHLEAFMKMRAFVNKRREMR
ncbi:hypothetical protein COB55_03050 [Candidatus Wolfebacteria bacterium]|nr:MAG: hypothetical protein COB55_03050 [Candidatus Wolfebacteria bacterium]